MSDDDETDLAEGEVLEVTVGASLEGMRVDRALAMLTDRSRADAATAIEAGQVALNGTLVRKVSRTLASGDVLSARVPERASDAVRAEANVPVDVVYDDDDVVVVNKDPRQVVHPGAGHRHGTLIAGLLDRYPEIARLAEEGLSDPERPGVVHRLDKGTSGLLVVAKSPLAVRSLSEQMAGREITRTYLALVRGHLAENRGVIDAPLGRSTRTPTMMAVRSDGRFARTHYDVRERVNEPYQASLLELRLETGRTHQIRVHVASIGHPIVNDLKYGHQRDLRLDEDRLFLHASALTFRHPRSAQEISVTATLPDDLRRLLPEGLSI